ncbi:AAA domain-containing protein [Candidatus Bathyarchaeota archaeon]|nr:AAA domain-containing protein [Candidatus Bathyarchaeota archaeon]
MTDIRVKAQQVLSEVAKVIVGYTDILQKVFISVLCDAHVLLEGLPGLAKTVMAKTFARVLGCTFRRIQFTPDLLPADITGSQIFNQKSSEFVFKKGPLFSNIVLADEINRAAPKTQSALLESMAEKQITVEGKTYPLDSPFIVIATQNPIEQEGTYPLPEAQLDRFYFKINMGYPESDDEVEIMRRQVKGIHRDVDSILNPEEIVELQKKLDFVWINTRILRYIRDVTTRTRDDPQIAIGAGPRASLVLMKASKARAAILGRNYVIPDDVKDVAFNALNHRMQLKPEAELEGVSKESVVNRILEEIPVPI